jgi:DNA-directed RNA polymerase specialized sigma24 family protein
MVGEAIVMAPAADASDPPAADRLARLFDRHHARLYRLARRMVRTSDEARDVVQDTFLRAARSPRSIPDGPSHEEAWLVRVLVNICRDGWPSTSRCGKPLLEARWTSTSQRCRTSRGSNTSGSSPMR